MNVNLENAGVYKLTCNINGKVYIGKTVNLKKRFRQHKRCENSSNNRYYLQNAISNHGWESFNIEILEIVENFDKLKDNNLLLELESSYIEKFDSTNPNKGYNMCKYSIDRTGIPHSEETKEKMRKPKSEETKKRMSESKIGHCHSDATKEKLRQKRLGKPLSEEHKEKLRRAKLGKKLSEEARNIRASNPNIGMTGKFHSIETKEKIRASLLKNKPKE